jgi:hypothetical protein
MAAAYRNSREGQEKKVVARKLVRTSLLSVWLGSVRKNRQSCHPEEPQAVLSETKIGPLHLPDSTNAGVLRAVYPERAERDPSLRSG